MLFRSPETQAFVGQSMSEHLFNMVDFRLSISVRVIEAIIYHPKLIRFGIDIYARDDTYTANDAFGVTAPLAADKTNVLGIILVQHRIIKEDIPQRAGDDFALHPLPQVAWLEIILFEKIPNRVVTPYLAVFGKVRQGIIYVRQQ